MNQFTPYDRWLTLLDHPYASRRLEAVHQARDMGETQIQSPLRRAALSDTDVAVRLAALETLITVAGDGTASLLREAVLDPDPSIRLRAVEALGDYRGEETAQALASRVDDEFDISQLAFRSLAKIGDEWAIAQLSALAATIVPSRQFAAISALGATRNPAAVPKLAVHLNSNEPRVRVAVVETLGNFGHSTEFTGAGAILVSTLLRSLDDPSPEVRATGAKALRHVKAWETCIPLNAALGDEESRVRQAAAETLTHLAAPTHGRMAIRALGLESPRLRAGAIRRLEALSDPTCLHAIAASLEDEDPAVRSAAGLAFRRLRLIPEPRHFQEALESEIPRLRANAIRCLTQRRDAGSIPRILEALKDPELDVQIAAARFLGELCVPDACPLLCEMLAHPSAELREAAIASLGRLGCRRALPALHERYKTFGGEPDRHLRKLLHDAIHEVQERADEHAHLPIAASPPEPERDDLPISIAAPTRADER